MILYTLNIYYYNTTTTTRKDLKEKRTEWEKNIIAKFEMKTIELFFQTTEI